MISKGFKDLVEAAMTNSATLACKDPKKWRDRLRFSNRGVIHSGNKNKMLWRLKEREIQ